MSDSKGKTSNYHFYDFLKPQHFTHGSNKSEITIIICTWRCHAARNIMSLELGMFIK